jgi:hypothetical protein
MHASTLSRDRAAAIASGIERSVPAFGAHKKTKPGTGPGFGCCFFLAEDSLGVP